MPAFLAPHKSGAHRVTAIALYRALLSKCRDVPQLSSAQSNGLKHVIRNIFAKNRCVTSRYILQNAFAGGYEALNHLNAATKGDKTSHTYIESLLSRLPKKLKTTTTPTSILPKTPSTTPSTSPTKPPAQPGTTLALRPRPLFSLPSRRRIPILVSANRIPILRFTKPQPASLSHYLKSRLVTRQRRIDRKAFLESAILLAKREDEWDDIISRAQIGDQGWDDVVVKDFGADVRARGKWGKGGKRFADGGRKKNTKERYKEGYMLRDGEPDWVQVPGEAYKEVCDLIEVAQEKNRQTAERMVEIVDREKEFAEVERKVRVRERNDMRRKRKAERGGEKIESVAGEKSRTSDR